MSESITTPQGDTRYENAKVLWEQAERIIEQMQDERRLYYEQAIAFGVVHLQKFTTLETLLDHYYDPRRINPNTRDWWVEAACAESPKTLNIGYVEDAAYYRRMNFLSVVKPGNVVDSFIVTNLLEGNDP